MRSKLLILLFLCAFYGKAQELYVQLSGVITVSDGAILTTGGGLVNDGDVEVNGELSTGGGLDNQGNIEVNGELITNRELNNDGRLDIMTESQMISLGNVNNLGFLVNNGIISLYSDWTNTGTYNTEVGEMVFLGGNDQIIFNSYLPIRNLTVNKIGQVLLRGDSIKVSEELNFEDGVLTVDENTQFIVSSQAEINQVVGSESYFDGEIISRGSGYRLFPVGDGGFYGNFAFLSTSGAGQNTEVGVSMIHQNTEPPRPADDVVGVSSENVWKVDLRKGQLDAAQLQIDFIAEDLENFTLENEIRRTFDSPVIAQSDSGATGPFYTLGIESLIDTDSITFGTIISGDSAQFTNLGSKYFAIALAPQIDPAGQIYFPNVFAPQASDPDNQTYKVFGEHIANEPFQIKIYNRFSKLVYSSNTFEESNQIGWNGVNSEGRDEPTGIFYVFVTYAYEYDVETLIEYSSSILLQR